MLQNQNCSPTHLNTTWERLPSSFLSFLCLTGRTSFLAFLHYLFVLPSAFLLKYVPFLPCIATFLLSVSFFGFLLLSFICYHLRAFFHILSFSSLLSLLGFFTCLSFLLSRFLLFLRPFPRT